MFSVRLINADSYQAQPLPQLDPTFSEFRGSEIKHVPIIRIFGTTSTGEKTCLHIHGVFPYLYVPYTGEEDPTSLAYRLSASLDAAINVSLGSATSNTQHVYLIQRVSGTPFYGYHKKEHQYLKIYFYNPAMIKRAADLLQNGSVLNQSLQPHEAHIPYILQFMMDYNVYGMSLVNLSSVKHRRLTQTLAELTSSAQSTTSDNSDIEYLPATIERQSTCELEIDALASNIINRREIESGLDLNPGLAAIWEEERARRAQAGFEGGDSQLVNPKSPPRPTFRPTDNDIYQEQRLARRLSMISQCDDSTLSTTPNQSVAYAAEVKDGENLLNSSNLLFSNPTTEKTQHDDQDYLTQCAYRLDSRTEAASQLNTRDCSILGTDDAQLVELLVQLAGGDEENLDSIDFDSLLGSQVPALRNGEKSDNEDEDNDVIDLNLTSLQLESLNSSGIPAEPTKEPSKNDEKYFSPTDLSPFILSYETSSSRSGDEESTKKRCQVPQYDGAGDVSPTLLNSDDEDNDTHPKEFSHLPKYKGSCNSASRSRKFDDLDDTLELQSNAVATTKDSEKSTESCRSSSPDYVPLQSSILPPVIVADEFIGSQYHGSNYEPLDGLLEIGPDFVPDLERLHSSMEIGILLSSADSDSPESVDEAPEDETIPLETVLNGDPCFMESAELDKSDLTELQDQYVSLLENSLLPDVHTNLRIDSDLGNSSNFSDSDYQTGEKSCGILLNVPSPRSSIVSRASSSSSENVAPNIQQPEIRNSTNDKFNVSHAPDKQSFNCKDSTRISTDNSDYNCNVVATWAELQNLQFVDKEKMEGRLGKSKGKGKHSQVPRQYRRRPNRRSDEKTASQILGLDSEKVITNTSTLSPHQNSNNHPLSPRKIVTKSKTASPIKITTNTSSSIASNVMVSEQRFTKPLVPIVNENLTVSPRVPDIAAEVEVVLQTSFAESDIRLRLDSSQETAFGSQNDVPDGKNSSSAICSPSERENAPENGDSKRLSPENRLDEPNESLATTKIAEGYSYYSSERSERDYEADGFAHWHCQLSLQHKIIQDEVFTSDQVWVIEKRKRGRKYQQICGGVCMRSDCSVPIVPLKKIVDKNHENSIIVDDFLKVEEGNLLLATKPSETKVPPFSTVSSTDELISPENRLISGKLWVQKNTIDAFSSESDGDVNVVTPEPSAEKNETNESINETTVSINETKVSINETKESINETKESINEMKESTNETKESINESKESINETVLEAIPGNKAAIKGRKSSEASAEIEASKSVNERSNHDTDSAHNSYTMSSTYSRKKLSRVRSSKKMNSIKNSRTTKTDLLQTVTRLAKPEINNLPGIPGVSEYRSDGKRGNVRKDAFNFFNGVSSENIPTENRRKTKNNMQPVVLTDWESKGEISSRPPNGLVNGVENCLTSDEKNTISPDRRTIDSPPFNFPPVSPIPKRNRNPHDKSKDLASSINQASTPKKNTTETQDLSEDNLSECVTLNLMMRQAKSQKTRAKLRILLEKRRKKTMTIFRVKETKTTEEQKSLSTENPLKEIGIDDPVAPENPELLTNSILENSTKIEDIHGQDEADDIEDNLEPSFETVTDVSETSKKNLEPQVHSINVITDNESSANSTLTDDICNTVNTEASGLFEAELDVLQNKISDVNHVQELFNERKELSYQTEQFMTSIVETNFFSGNNYAIDAVSNEIPACLFEEDSNSVDKRSPKKIVGDSRIANESQNNSHDAYSDSSVDYRDLDVYDVESLTPSSSLATLNEAALDGTEMSLTFSETTESSIVENSMYSEMQSASTCRGKLASDFKNESIVDSSFEEASPEFEALSPSPKICNLIEPLEEEFAVHSTIAVLKTRRGFDHSLINTTDDFQTQTPGGKLNAAVDNSELDHEIQDLVSQVVMQIQNESNLYDSESLFIEVLDPVLDKNVEGIAVNSEVVKQGIEKSESLSKINREKNIWNTAQKNEKPIQICEFANSALSEALVEEIKSVAKETKCQVEVHPSVTHKREVTDRIYESEGENDKINLYLAKKSFENHENHFITTTQYDIIDDKGLGTISENALPKKSSKCRPVSIKLVNIDLKRFDGFQPKYSKPLVTEADFFTKQDCLPENFENIIPKEIKVQELAIDENKETQPDETSIKRESSVLIGINDKLRNMQATSMESITPFQIPGNGEEIVNTIPRNFRRTCKKIQKIEKPTSSDSCSPFTIFNENEIFEMTMTRQTRSSHNHSKNKPKRMFEKSILPARRSRRKCAEKTRQKLAQQTSLQLSSAESQPSAEESEIVTENDIPEPESRLHNESDNLSTHEITVSKSESNTVLQPLKYASTDVRSSYLTKEEKEEEISTVELKNRKSSTEKTGTENSPGSGLSTQKFSHKNKAPYAKCENTCSQNSSQKNSRDTSPEIHASTEENTSADENVKPNSRPRVYSRKSNKSCRKRRPVRSQFKIALQRPALPQQAKISLDSQSLTPQISSDKKDQKNTCSLQHRLRSQIIADTNNVPKDSLSSEERSEAGPKTLKNDKKLLKSDLPSRLMNRNTINSQSYLTSKRRRRFSKASEVKPSIEEIFEENSQDAVVKKSKKTKVFSETVVKNENDAILEDDYSTNIVDESELCASKIVGCEEPRISTNFRRRGLREKITKRKNSRTSSKKNVQDVLDTNTEGLDSSPDKIAMGSPDVFMGAKRNRRTKKTILLNADKSNATILSSPMENTENPVRKSSQTIDEVSLLSQQIGEKEIEASRSNNADASQLCESNVPLEKNPQNTMENTSQEVESTSRTINEDSSEPEPSVIATIKTRSRKCLQSNLQKPVMNIVSFIDENAQSTEKSTSEIPKLESKLPHDTKDKNIDPTILVSAETSNLNTSKMPDEKSADNVIDQISQELESSSPKISKQTKQKPRVKPKKKVRQRKVSIRKIKALSTKSVPTKVMNDQCIDVKDPDNYEKSGSLEIEENYTTSEMSTLNPLNLSPEQCIESLSPQKILENRTEPEISVNVKKKGRPRRSSALNSRKSRQPKNVDEKTYKNLEESKLSQNLDKDENDSTNVKAATIELSVSKSFSTEKIVHHNEEKISKVFPDEIIDEDVQFDTSASSKLQTIAISEKVFSQSEFPLSSTEETEKSENLQNLTNLHLNNQTVCTESELTPAETNQGCSNEVLDENTSSFTYSAREKVEKIVFIESTGNNRLRKRRSENALSQSEDPMEKGDRDSSEDSQTPEIVPPAITENNSEPEIMTKRRSHFEKRSELNVNEIHTENNSKPTSHANVETLEKTRVTARRKKGRSEKTTDTNNLKMESVEENCGASTENKSSEESELLSKRGRSREATNTNNPKIESAKENSETPTEEKFFEESKLSPKCGRSEKDTDTNNSKMDSVEDNAGDLAKEKSLNETQLPPKITVTNKIRILRRGSNGRFAKQSENLELSTKKDDYDNRNIADETSQSQPLLPRIMETGVETESISANKKLRQRKILTTSTEDTPQDSSTTSSEQISLKLPLEKLVETDTELQTSVTNKKRIRNAKKSELAEKEQEFTQLIGLKITENFADPRSPSRNMKRTRSEKSPEPIQTILDKTLSEANLPSHQVPNEIVETPLPVRPQKRVRFDEDSIRNCTEQLKSSELFVDENIVETSPNEHKKYCLSLNRHPSPTKTETTQNNRQSEQICRTTRTTSANHGRDVSVLKDHQLQTQNPADLETNNGVKSDCTISSNDNASRDLSSLQEYSTRHPHHENSRKFPERAIKFEAQEQAIQSDQREQSKEIQPNDLDLGTTKEIQSFTNSEVSLPETTKYRSEPFVLPQEPIIILQRLTRHTLESYGFEYSAKNKNFVKNLKKHRPNTDYQVPAYDGPADLSSDESEDDPADVTVTREEKRVCVYQSEKKTTKTKKESIITPWKRKLDEAPDTKSPIRKYRAVANPGPSSKTSPSSPNRTSMLKSPGRVSGYYQPLQIIITSPKVRKETSEAQDADVRLENRNILASASACLTPRRKNQQRLHENLLRGRISATKSTNNVIGDKRATSVTMGSQRAGELDEIKSGEQRERIALNISTITSECDGTTGSQNLTSTFRGGKDVRKKLVFSTVEDARQTDQILNDGLDNQSTNFQTFSESIGHRSIVNYARKSIEVLKNLANDESISLDPQPGPSHLDSVPVDENLALYEVTTDEDSEDDYLGNITFTQYIDSQIEKNQVLTLHPSKLAEETKEIVSLRPKFNPPNRQRIIDTMENYGIPKYRNQEPFFSNETDVPKQKELAQRMLKVPGKGLKDLSSFISSVEGVTGIVRWRKMKINELQPALAKSKDINAIRELVGDDIVSLTPLIKPPTQNNVKNWLRARDYLEKEKNKEKNEKKKQNAKKTKELEKIEIQGNIAGTEDEKWGPNDLDLSVIEASPEKTVGGTDSGNTENCTLKMKLAKKGLLKKAEDLKKCRLMPSEGQKAKDSVRASASGERTSVTQNFSSTEIDPSLLSILGKSHLFKDREASRHLGVSCGQIEFLSDSTRSDVANENLQNAKALTRYQYLTIMCLEVHVSTRGDLLPDAQHDSISAIFYSVQSDVPPDSNIKPLEHGVIILADEEKAKNKMHYSYASKVPWSICFVDNEEALLNALVTLITRTDPEILIGWELETLSWGYVFQRATRLGMNLSKRISRIPATQCKWETPAPDIESMAEVKLPGRIVLDIWRMMRHEAALLSYTFESVMHHVLNERVPCPSFKILTDWWDLKRPRPSRWRVIEHYSLRVLGVFRMLDQLDIIGRTSELARLFGIQFYEVFSRGSQYRVESVMLRLAKPLNYIAVSPTPLQRASMRAMEALPLILEPESKFYSDPLIVLDFQSLYPSIIIAHNYCFSTCLGRIEHIGQPQPFEFGAYTLRVSKSTALKLKDKVNYAPCGVAYVKPEVRLGILPRMLTEILETRFMVKKAMKDHKQADKTLQRALHSRQHGLKFLANVTYGYTAANFSGRMPCIEVGDSVISKSKETLERAIRLVEATPKWGARVVYGDTDSLFILVPGKSKAEAFVIGNEIADAVTASNLPPIKLKFEKVMYPSILQTKKRYCGYMYETPDQQTPTYLAKGIETVRRDGCPAVSKILEKTLKILFDTKDVSLVKKYVTRQLDKVLRGKVSIQDLTFAKEFRGLKGYKAKACVPTLELTRRLMRKDPRAVPRNSERVRYVIVAGAPNQALIHCVRTPWELINDPGLRPNAIYYVTRVIIPPLNRCLNLMGVDVNDWYREMPHRQILNNPVGQPVDKQKLTIFQYFGTIVCVSCGEPSSKGICAECLASPADTLVVLHEKLRWLHRTYDHVTAICQSCVGQIDIADCSSLECPILYRRAQAQRELSQTTNLRKIIESGNTLEF